MESSRSLGSTPHPPSARTDVHPTLEVLGEEPGLVLQYQGPSPVLEVGTRLGAEGWDAAWPPPSFCCPSLMIEPENPHFSGRYVGLLTTQIPRALSRTGLGSDLSLDT